MGACESVFINEEVAKPVNKVNDLDDYLKRLKAFELNVIPKLREVEKETLERNAQRKMKNAN